LEGCGEPRGCRLSMFCTLLCIDLLLVDGGGDNGGACVLQKRKGAVGTKRQLTRCEKLTCEEEVVVMLLEVEQMAVLDDSYIQKQKVIKQLLSNERG
jgi:hypothetical protein